MKRPAWHPWIAASAFVLLLVVASHLGAQTVTMYRCTDAAGRVTIQNDTPCPKGSRQEKRSVEIDASAAPFPRMQTITPVAPPAQPTPDPLPQPPAGSENIPRILPLPEAEKPVADRLPPPPLFRCRTVENDSYLADSGEPRQRCLALDTVGIGGIQSLGAGQACSVVYDQCQRVPDEQACEAWRQRVAQAQSAWTFSRADSRVELKNEYERIARVVADTTCNEQ